MKYLSMILILFINSVLWGEPQEIPIFTYHTHAPFIIGEQIGLSYDLAEYLNELAGENYNFTVLPMPRARVDKMLYQNEEGIIPWVNPGWFSDIEESDMMWTDGILMEDGNAVLSNVNTTIEYTGPESVEGMKFGGVRGHHYVNIDTLVDQGEIIRIDADNHIDNIRKLTKNRIDFTITPYWGALFLLKSNNMEDEIHISSEMHSRYNRRVIITHQSREMKEFLELVIQKMKTDPMWNTVMSKYN